MARITSKKLTDQTADRLFQMIISDPELCPGSKLPNETELCALFGVSRTTVREAVRFLAAQGYVEVRRGLGTFVAPRTTISQDIGLPQLETVQVRLQDLFEIRLMIEPTTAMLACHRGTQEELDHIFHCADEVARRIRSGRDWDSADVDFHHAFVAASHNQFMEQLVPNLHLADGGLLPLSARYGDPGQRPDYQFSPESGPPGHPAGHGVPPAQDHPGPRIRGQQCLIPFVKKDKKGAAPRLRGPLLFP